MGGADKSGVSRGCSGKFLMTVDDTDAHATFLQKPGTGESDDPRSNDHDVLGRARICSAQPLITHRISLKRGIGAEVPRTFAPCFGDAAKNQSGDLVRFPRPRTEGQRPRRKGRLSLFRFVVLVKGSC
jgi:hypothetical protein